MADRVDRQVVHGRDRPTAGRGGPARPRCRGDRIRPVGRAAQQVRPHHAAPPAHAQRRSDRELGPRSGIELRRARPRRHGDGVCTRLPSSLLQRRLPSGRGGSGGRDRRAVRAARAAARARPAGNAGLQCGDEARHATTAGGRQRPLLRRPPLAARTRPRARSVGRVRRSRRVPVLQRGGPGHLSASAVEPRASCYRPRALPP